MSADNLKYRGVVTTVQIGDSTAAQVKYGVAAWSMDDARNVIYLDPTRPKRDGVGAIDDLEIQTPLAVGAAIEVSFQDGEAILTLIDEEKYAYAECTG